MALRTRMASRRAARSIFSNTIFKPVSKLFGQSRSDGYDYQFVEEPSDDLKCLICLCVARDPQQHGDGGCGKIYCTSCIDKYKETNDKCPNCRKVITTFKDERSKWMNNL